MLKVFQNRAIINLSPIVNRVPFDQLMEKYPELKCHHECSMRGSKAFESSQFMHYTHVADVNTDDLEKAFNLMNGEGDYQDIIPITGMRSMSVGDIIKTEAGKYFMCDSQGFAEIEVVQND